MAKQPGTLKSAALLSACFVCAGGAQAAGFSLTEHSAQGMGNAFAGGGAVAEDASTVWYNPASITRLGRRIQASGHFILPGFDFTDRGSVQLSTSGTSTPLLPGAPSTASGDRSVLVPNLYYVHEITHRLSFGLAVNAPFGLVTEYDPAWKGRYQNIRAEITDLNVNPAIAFKVNERLSVGVGVSLNYIDAQFTQAVDVTAVCLTAAGAAAASCTGFDPANAPTFGAGQGGNDGFLTQDGDDLSLGFNLGISYVFNGDTRVSAAYRSQIRHTLEGDAEFTLPSTISTVESVEAGVRSLLGNSALSVGANLPDTFSLSMYHRFHPRFAAMADATWTGWSAIQGLRFVYDNPATLGGMAVETLNWKNTWRLGLGLSYYHNKHVTLRTGVAYDESPVSSPITRSPRLPDNDRIWVSLGASYRFGDNLSADVGYAHLFIDDTPIFRTGGTGSVLNGRYKSDANLFSVQINYVFD